MWRSQNTFFISHDGDYDPKGELLYHRDASFKHIQNIYYATNFEAHWVPRHRSPDSCHVRFAIDVRGNSFTITD